MCSFVGYKCKSCIIVQFSGLSWSMKNTTGQTYSEPEVGIRLTAKDSNVGAQTMANSADHPRGSVWSGSTLFAIPAASFGCITLW